MSVALRKIVVDLSTLVEKQFPTILSAVVELFMAGCGVFIVMKVKWNFLFKSRGCNLGDKIKICPFEMRSEFGASVQGAAKTNLTEQKTIKDRSLDLVS